MDIEAVRKERQKWLDWKNIRPLRKMLEGLPKREGKLYFPENGAVGIDIEIDDEVVEVAKSLKPWRKGPFQIGNLFIDSEWRSQIKYSIIQPHLNIENQIVGDIGCNNGYYMFRMLEERPKKIVGFDPSPLFRTQFDFIDSFIDSGIEYELLGVEHLQYYGVEFDTLLALGILYHRSDPIASLKSLRQGLKKGGTLILDTFYIEGDEEYCLFPKHRYSKIPNIYFVPTIPALENWIERAKFSNFEVIGKYPTTTQEQRKTDWIDGESLDNFLDPLDSSKTVEGYPAPKRVYIKVTK
ncbi:MAG TPA: tRNA 5-methoxyuridine(34)/uridine 5-oxyacetic acid(34) synthase CmoB [Campylobacterales bacterium]|nr:tRNA 5-methoxyuridine(34)/uridine 5-oxyacetic acid(34) synthase CmoB [Campylobacterales bacterium]